MRKRLFYFAIGMVLLFIFALFSREIKHGAFKELDLVITVKIQDHIPTRFEDYGKLLALGGNPLFTSIIVLFITLWQIIRGKNMRHKIAALIIPIGFALIILAELYGKSVVHHPSPYFFLLKNPKIAAFPKYYIQREFSYPSGPVARVTYIALIVFITSGFKNRKKRITLAIMLAGYVGAVTLSQIYLGYHWFSDILGGFVIGAGFSFLIRMINN